ncbi:MAG: glycosyltransferase, partial [Planctomycetes bacterium]|nr:glycosyltransferase [Planctomycetota bacterium]
GEIEEREGVKLFRSLSFEENTLTGLYRLYTTIKDIKADIYVLRSASLAVACSAFITKLMGHKFIYMVANDDEAHPKKLASWCGRIPSIAMGWLYKNAYALTVQSKDQDNSFLRHRNIKSKGLVKNLFIAPPPPVEQTERNTILWIGRCDPIKRCELFLDLAEAHPDYSFTMICQPSLHKDYWQEISSRAQALPQLKLIESLPREQIAELYNRTQVLVITSQSEGYSNVMMEACFHQCPLLTLNVNPDNIIQRFELGFSFPDTQFGEFSQTLDKMIKDPKSRKQMGQNGQEYIMKNHHPDKGGNIFLRVIEDL